MTLIKKIRWTIALSGFSLIVALLVWRNVSFWKEFRAFKTVIREHNLRIIGQWWYEEDFVLESFGTKVATNTSQFWIDFRMHPSQIKDPNDQISGILVQHEEGLKFKAFAVESHFWNDKNLPTIKTFSDFLKNADVITPKLQNADVASFNYQDVDWERFRRYVIIRFNDEPGMPEQSLKH